MGSVRLALILGGLGGAAVVGACGLESGGILDTNDSGDMDVPIMTDGGGMDMFVLPEAPMDIMTPDLGTGETESGVACTCTPPLPGGWAFVTYEQKSRPACSMGYDSSQNTVENIVAPPATCSCMETSMPSSPPTCDANVTFTIGFDKFGQCNTVTDNNLVCAGTCTATNKNYSSGGGDFTYFGASGTATATGGTCAAPTPSMSKQAATSDQGRFCKLKGAPGACGMGACVTTPMLGDAICIWRPGILSCAMTGFPNTHYVGDNITDTRGCGPDPCNSTKVSFNRGNCSTPALTLFTDNKCMTNLLGPQTANNTCTNVGITGNTLAFSGCSYTSTNSNPSCSYVGSYGATGNATPSNVQTICCL